jgi:hypothetical protein
MKTDSGHLTSASKQGGTLPEPYGEREWKLGDELLPFHPSASHVPPDYRDGWNACYYAALPHERRKLAPDAAVPMVQSAADTKQGEA